MNAITAALTEKQLEFVKAIGKGMTPAGAAEVAGYVQPDQAAWVLKSSPQVQAAVAAELRRFLLMEAAPAALKVLYDFMVDPDVDKKLRAACAKTVADRAGFIAPKASDNSSLGRKTFIDMSADELRQASNDILKELSERATIVIDSAPSGAQPEPYPFDVLG